jgi:hypothetical protein
MEKCKFLDFMKVLKPWLDSDYIQHARYDEKGNFTLTFVNGGQNSYQVDECTAAELKGVIELIKNKNIPVFQ